MNTVKLGNWKIVITTQANLSDAVFPFQTHGDIIISAEECRLGESKADGIYTDSAENSIGINTADCLPLVLLTDTKALALHVSRKTLIRGLVEKSIAIIKPEEITHIYIGPHICERHFSFEYVGDEIQEFMKKFPNSFTEKDGAIHLSLTRAVEQYISQWGLQNIETYKDDRCTFEDETLASYRRTGKANPGISTIIRAI